MRATVATDGQKANEKYLWYGAKNQVKLSYSANVKRSIKLQRFFLFFAA